MFGDFGNEPVCAASLIKLFVMQKIYQDYNLIVAQDANYSGDEQFSKEKIGNLLESMIEWSDNESYNELMRMMSPQRVFSESCGIMNDFLEEEGYEATCVYHTLQPSETEDEGISNDFNSTSVADCAYLLESIYQKQCVSEEASASMLEFLLNQQVTHKIPAGVPEGAIVANKTGETDEVQHDAAIVYTYMEEVENITFE